MARKKLIVRDEQGKFLRTDVFREAALYFSKHGCYTPDPYLSPGWYDYWREQRRRIMDGYSVAGVKITGEHYFYLNFCLWYFYLRNTDCYIFYSRNNIIL